MKIEIRRTIQTNQIPSLGFQKQIQKMKIEIPSHLRLLKMRKSLCFKSRFRKWRLKFDRSEEGSFCDINVSKADSENEDWNYKASSRQKVENYSFKSRFRKWRLKWCTTNIRIITGIYCFKSRFRKWRLKSIKSINNICYFYIVSKADSENEDWN